MNDVKENFAEALYLLKSTDNGLLGKTNLDWQYIPDNWRPYVPYYPQINIWNREDNKTAQAFKIVQKLIDKKLVKLDKVKDFIEMVNEIVELL